MPLSKSDKLFISNEISNKINESVSANNTNLLSYLDARFQIIENDVSYLKKRIKILPTSEEFLSRMDRWWTEFKHIKEENIFNSHQISRNTKRIEKLEAV